MSKPKVIVLSGYGLNCEEETKYAFDTAGGLAEIVHLNDLISGGKRLKNYQIMAVPGGFAFGDDTGSGKAYANRMKNHLQEQLNKFVEEDKLAIGICNGFQILTQAGLLPGALVFNDSARYIDRWVDLKVVGQGPWLTGVKSLMVPIAHGEGKYVVDVKTLASLKKKKAIAVEYTKGEICNWQDLPVNPNGSLANIAGVTAMQGRILGLMPHPERAMFFTQLPHWQYLKQKYQRMGQKLPALGPGMKIFQNAINYFN